MDSSLLNVILTDGLWLAVAIGWVFLLFIGLEADRPMSGGLPGHTPTNDEHSLHRDRDLSKLGEYGAWLVFVFTSLTLPFILWWIFTS